MTTLLQIGVIYGAFCMAGSFGALAMFITLLVLTAGYNAR